MDKRNLQRLLKILLVIGDIFFIAISFFITYYMRFYLNLIPVKLGIPDIRYYLYLMPFVVFFYLLSFNYSGLYIEIERKSIFNIFSKIFVSSLIAVVFLLSFTFFIREITYSRVLMFIFWIISFIVLFLWRICFRNLYHVLHKHEIIIQRIVIVGATELSKMLIERIQRNTATGYKIIGFLDNKIKKAFYNIPYLGKIKDLNKIIKKYEVDEIFIGIPDFDRKKLTEFILSNENVQFKIASDILGLICRNVEYDELFEIPVFSVKDLPLDKMRNRFIKRTLDIVLSVIILLLTFPLFVLIGIIIKLTSKGPVFYKQERISRGEKNFKMLKFRTMRIDAEKETGPVWAKQDDKRVTFIGRILRKTSIDELPQFINVLKGDMSIVGPRPERPFFVNKFKQTIPRYVDRHKVRAGITGWAQINGLRGNTSLEERVKYDLYYIQNWSLWFDIKIIIRTILEVFHHKHAY